MHGEDVDVDVGNGVGEAVDEKRGFGGVAGCAGGIPVR